MQSNTFLMNKLRPKKKIDGVGFRYPPQRQFTASNYILILLHFRVGFEFL